MRNRFVQVVREDVGEQRLHRYRPVELRNGMLYSLGPVTDSEGEAWGAIDIIETREEKQKLAGAR